MESFQRAGLFDSRNPLSPGYLPLQDHGFINEGIPLENRANLIGVRVKKRGEYGEYYVDQSAVGDLTNALFWPSSGGSNAAPGTTSDRQLSRPIGGWSFAWGSVVHRRDAAVGATTPSGGGGGAYTPGGGGGAGGGSSRAPGDVPANTRTPGGGATGYYGDLNKPVATPTQSTNPYAPGNTYAEDKKSGGMGSQRVSQIRIHGSKPKVLPLIELGWDTDKRFEKIESSEPGSSNKGANFSDYKWSTLPDGLYGITVAADNEDEQIPQFHPTDGRLFSVTFGNPDCATYVHDINDLRIDDNRKAPLHAMARIIYKPRGQFSLGGVSSNSLSWNIGVSAKKDVLGGFVNDDEGPDTVYGHVSVRCGGPFDVSPGDCKHNIGQTGDGDFIFPLHFSTMSFMRMDSEHDGPMWYETPYPSPPEGLFPVKCHIGWDAGQVYRWSRDEPTRVDSGVWKIWSACLFTGDGPPTTKVPVTTTPDDKEPKDPPPPDEPPTTTPGGGDPGTPGETTPGGGAGGGTPSPMPTNPGEPGGQPTTPDQPPPAPPPPNGGGGRTPTYRPPQPGDPPGIDPTDPGTWPSEPTNPDLFKPPQPKAMSLQGDAATQREPHASALTTLEVAMPAETFRAFYIEPGRRNVKNILNPTENEVKEFRTKSPTTMRVQAFAAQNASGEFAYTQKPGPESRSTGGTASGGIAFTVPEYDLGNINDGFSVNGVTKSTSRITLTPGVQLSFGTPILSSGGNKNGHTILDSSNQLVISAQDASGTSTIISTHTSDGIKFAGKYGFNNQTPSTVSTGWSISGLAADKTYNCATPDLTELGMVVGTLIEELKTKGLISS